MRIGIDRLEGAATGDPRDWTGGPLASFPRGSFAELADVRHHRRVTVLDVRQDSEYAERHVEGAVGIPLHELLSRLDEVPAGEVWVHCASGYRASIAASVLEARGARSGPIVVVDDDLEESAPASGLPLTGAST